MAACSTWKYSHVTPAAFEKLRALGKQQGFSIPNAPSGGFKVKVAGFQIGFEYAWDSYGGFLRLTCMSKPNLLGCSTIKGFADKIVVQCGGKPA